MDQELYNSVDRAWKKTCKVVLGDEIGELKDYRDYLKKYTEPIEWKKSSISGHTVIVPSDRFLPSARFICNDEIPELEKGKNSLKGLKLDINQLKDLDSLRETIAERAHYAGSIVLGNSASYALSHRCVNVNCALECQDIYDGRFVAFSTSMKGVEYFFGGSVGSMSQFCIKTLENYKLTRCFETQHCNIASDCYFSSSLENCSDCLFSFNQRDKRFLVGNLELQKSKYLDIKAKLLSEIREALMKEHDITSISDIVGGYHG